MKLVNQLCFHGLPTFLRLRCEEAKRGGTSGYDLVGYELTRNLSRLSPDDADPAEWDDECERIIDLAASGRDEDEVLEWFIHHYPRCLRLVPKSRRPSFLRGVFRMAQED